MAACTWSSPTSSGYMIGRRKTEPWWLSAAGERRIKDSFQFSVFSFRLKGLTCPPKTDPHVKLEWWIEGRQGDEQEAVYSGADHWKAAGSRGGVITQSKI